MKRRLLTIGETARQLHLSVDKMRQLADVGEIEASRTEGGHRRFTEEAVEQFQARRPSQRSSKTSRPHYRASRVRKVPVRRPERMVFGDVDEDDLGLEDDFFEEEEAFESVYRPSVQPVPVSPSSQSRPASSPPVQTVTGTASNAVAEREQAAQREKSRLQDLKNWGTILIPFDVPTAVRAKIVEELEAYVTTERLPAWVSSLEQHNLVRGKIDGIVQSYRAQAAEAEALKKAEQAKEAAARNLKAENERKVQTLIAGGLAYADQELWEFDLFDRSEIRSEVERALKEEVRADWSQRDVETLVDDVLDEEGEEDD